MGHDFDVGILAQRGSQVVAVAHIDDDEHAAARIAPSSFQHTLGQMRSVGMPGVPDVLTGQPGDGVVQFIRHMMPPALIDGSGIGRSALEPNQAASQ